jgi:hypothetical protein
MFIEGEKISKSNLYCYIPMFAHNNFNQKAYIVGALVMNHYYTVFDMSPEEERNEGYIQIGIGERNIEDELGSNE